MKKKTVSTYQSLKKKLDAVFSIFIRLRDSEKGIVTCPLCWKRIPRKQAQNMHFISRSVLKYRYDEDNCFAGCMRCNVILNGNYQVYTLRMINRYWKEFVEKRINDKSIFKVGVDRFKEKIEEYTQKVNAITKK